jgi:hypothetical protein
MKHEELTRAFELMFKAIGLSGMQLEVRVDASRYDRVSVGLFTSVQVSPLDARPSFAKFEEELHNNVLNSQLVTGEIQEWKDRLQVSQSKRDELERENQELEKYKTHYDLQFNLQHGKKPT